MSTRVCLCGKSQFVLVHAYTRPPQGETRFLPDANRYRRTIWRCDQCGHFISVHDMNLQKLYEGAYVDASYGPDGLEEAFNRINALDETESDNANRVRRILGFSETHFSDRPGRSVLDVGSGLCVFLYRMREAGWDCTAVDPDVRAVQHAEEVVGVRGVCGDFMTLSELGRFDLVTFNKVLEHVENPVAMLSRGRDFVGAEGVVYVELPDGECAAREGFQREEFFVEHLHVFSMDSMTRLAELAGYRVVSAERLREPSSKFTLRAFLAPDNTASNLSGCDD